MATSLKFTGNTEGAGGVTLKPASASAESQVVVPTSGTLATTAQIPDTSNLATKPEVNGKISLAGNRGQLAGCETTTAGNVISETSPDTQYSSGAVTVQNGTSGKSWTKVMMINNTAHTVTLQSNWKWVGGSAPELKIPCVLTAHWNNNVGIANLICGA